MLNLASPPRGLAPLSLDGLATTVTRKAIDAKQPEWAARQDLWFNAYVLYEGGQLICENRERFLKQRPREDNTVYRYRLDHFCYENNLGTGLGWHEAEMFRNPPAITSKVAGANGEPTDAKLTPEQDDFYARFQKDCDRHGTGLVDKYRQVFRDLLLYQHSWVLTDMPAQDAQAPVQSLADQKSKRLLDPHISVVSPCDVINWDCDEYGNVVWAVIYSKTQQRSFIGTPVTVERWYYYDRQTYRVYEAQTEGDADAAVLDADKQPVKLVRAGYHPLAKENRVPLQRICVPAGWWLANRTYLACMEHLNLSNALKWSLFMAAMAVPVVFTDDDVTGLTQSEAGFLKFSAESKYQFAEPQGNCWDAMAKRVEVLKEEIYRSLYLIAQSRSNKATAAAQSGVSKEQDMKPSHDVLNGLGDILRNAMQATLQNVAAARALIVPGMESDNRLLFDVQGFQFDESISTDDVDKLTGLHGLAVPSATFEKELDKQIVQRALPDMNPETKEAIFAEIDAAPTREQKAAAEKEAEAQRMRDSMTTALEG